MKNKLGTLMLMAFVILIGLNSCRKDIDQTEPENMTTRDLQVSETFDWKTTKDIQLTLTGNIAGLIEVANSDGIAYQRIYLLAAQPYVMNLTVPTYETSVRLKYNGQDVTLNLTSNTLSYQF